MFKKILTLIFVFIFIFSSSLQAFAALDVTKLPLGDGKVSSSAKAGYVYSCQQNFNSANGGASDTAPWIHGSTWNLSEKLNVSGKVVWPDAKFSMKVNGATRTVTSNSLPVDSYTGTFPIPSTDAAYAIDKNPNTIKAQSVSIDLPATPTPATTPSCVNMGMIGVALNGVAIFNALDDGGRDAVAHEVQDLCDGHPEMQGEYHYHGPSTCMPHQNENNTLVGYAIDGYGIFSSKDKNGNEITDADLDACHGTTSEILWDGKTVNMYHYVLTQEYPYTVGCFMGTPIKTIQANPSSGANSNPPSMMMSPSSSNTNASISSTLKYGSKGDEVVALQNFLTQKGFLVLPQGTTKGTFGLLTQKALIKFQKANGISATGVFGAKSRAIFNSSTNLNPNQNTTMTPPPMMNSNNGMLPPPPFPGAPF